MINNTWKPWIKLVETENAENIIKSVPQKYRELVALVLSAAKWHPSRREVVKPKGIDESWFGTIDVLSIHNSLANDNILCILYMAILGIDCKECPLYDKKKQVDCANGSKSKIYVKYISADFLEDKDKYADLFYKKIVKAYKKELKKFPELR